MPRVSIIIAAYNVGNEIRVLFDSLCRSRFQDFEICLCDDASSDDTRLAAQSYSDRFPILLTANQANCGVALARNQALAMARAPLLLFLDADVRLRPETIDQMLERMETSRAGVVEGIYSETALDPGPFSDYYALFSHHSFLLGGALPRYNVFNGWCALCRREVMDAAGGHWEVPKGMEVENESLGRRIAALGFGIFLDPRIAVDHHWGGLRKLLFIFTRRVYWWVKVFFASDRRFEAALTTRSYALGTAALPAAILALLAGGGQPAGRILAGVGLAVFLWAYAPFYAFARRKRGLFFLLWSMFLSAAFSFVVVASAAYSAAEELLRLALRGRTTLAPERLRG